MEFAGLSPATAQLAVELQLADIRTIMQGPVEGDEFAAFDAMRTCFQDALLLLQDQVFAINILRADHDNRVAFNTLIREERQAEQDHNYACELSGIAPDRDEQPSPTSRDHFDGQVSWLGDDCGNPLSVFANATMEEPIITTLDKCGPKFSASSTGPHHEAAGDEPNTKAESSTRRISKGKGRARDTTDVDEHVTHTFCSACMEQCARFDVLQLGCKRPEDVTYHAYCRTCLIDLFQTSLTDTTLFPPRCCGERIPISACIDLCPPGLVNRFKEKELEMASLDPIYCSNRYCAKFIKPENVNADVATCQGCQAETCVICKNPRHKGVCPADPTVQMLMNLAGEKRWSRCPRCRTMVELLMGCYQMRCRCGGEFCYLCAKPWKTCSCSQWDENRLLSNTQVADVPGNHIAMPEEEEILEADPSLDVSNDIQLRLATVVGGFAIVNEEEEAADNADHIVSECRHRWVRAYGKHGELEVCGICHHHLKFVNACVACKTQACNRCLNNRL